jgi:hypothetical protein
MGIPLSVTGYWIDDAHADLASDRPPNHGEAKTLGAKNEMARQVSDHL